MSVNESRDMNRDPITGTPGSHPLGTGVGAAGGALAGAAIGSLFGPIGTLVGGALGTIGGGAAGHTAAERVDPTGEATYWRENVSTRPYYKSTYDFDTDYAPAYAYGSDARARHADRRWDDRLENDLASGWDKAKAKSRLTWAEAKDAVRDAWNRDDRTYRTYEASDRYYSQQFGSRDRDARYDYETDYRPAYRYGTWARTAYPERQWDSSVESDLERGWDAAKGTSRMAWNDAKGTVREAWDGLERAIPGDSDHDGL
ncbi:MAG TPA: hypothetical protein VLM17_00405 [Xanthomonadaceae bacterium]|nr:hypothetical protein [Xanthomonadaceae bacterium]